jgi:hypothetical protein
VIAHLLTFALALPAAPADCPPGPAGSVCLPPATRTVGAGATKREVALARAWIDTQALRVKDAKACVAMRACEGSVSGEDDTAAQLTFLQAERACAFIGKRLPSEAEWEVAQALAPSTEKLEWTGTWFAEPSSCAKPLAEIAEATHGSWPAALCGERDRLDPCEGASFCGVLTHKLLKRFDKPTARDKAGWGSTKRAAVRCASSAPFSASSPSSFITHKRAPRPIPTAPSAEQLATFGAIEEDVLDTPLCDEVGRSYADCRDPRSYLKTNEPRQDVVLETLANLGGGYTGVGSDQNYTLVAAARPEWAWLFDYDPNVVNWHRVLAPLVRAAPDRHAFVAWFSPDKAKEALALVQADAKDAKDKRLLSALFTSSSPKMRGYYAEQAKDAARAFTWLGSDDGYAYVRAMITQGRMRAFKGNMLDVHTMRGIAAAASKLGVSMRVYYPSNAHEFWPFTDAYRDNVAALPFDERSVVVQTISSVKTGFGQSGYWHYNIQHGFEHQRLLRTKSITRERQLLTWRMRTASPELTLSGLP